MSEALLAPTYPRILRPVWRLTEPDSTVERRCDALNRPSVQRLLRTANGDYWVCGETGQLERTEFGVEKLPAFYDQYWAEAQVQESKTPKQRRFIEEFKPYRQTNKLFEAGTGLGGLLKVVVEAGWDAQGCELSPQASERAAAYAGAPVHAGAIEDIELEDGAYDVILLDNVFEHLRAPRDVLHKLTSALRPGGVLFVLTLNAQSLSLRHSPTAWYYFNPGHLYVPTVVSFNHYASDANLNIRKLATHGFSAGGATKDAKKALPPSARLYKRFASLAANAFQRGHRLEAWLQKPE